MRCPPLPVARRGSASEKEYLQQINKLLSEVGTLSGANTQWERDVKFLTDELNAVREKYDHASKVCVHVLSAGASVGAPFCCFL